ncbi:conserved hypothetical protein [Helicobacter hepaticus ATCC 51449]|uniref:Uncharacterized protein n=1 Tax=Helicobacter hepaticus (strain ATCC 51449 / 3B1) TaxID=235279 RepID=Q7VI09_HELHP|nr:conserved hypothetical protein [Helicobacter hepaticus ATCC 51449]
MLKLLQISLSRYNFRIQTRRFHPWHFRIQSQIDTLVYALYNLTQMRRFL